MFRIKTLNQISPTGLSVLDASRFTVSDGVENEDGVLVRSADMQEYVFPPALRAIARAGAGTNNIPVDRCSESGIVVFNTPGANANAVILRCVFITFSPCSFIMHCRVSPETETRFYIDDVKLNLLRKKQKTFMISQNHFHRYAPRHPA